MNNIGRRGGAVCNKKMLTAVITGACFTVLCVLISGCSIDPMSRVPYTVVNETGETVKFELVILLCMASEILAPGEVFSGTAGLDGEYGEDYGMVKELQYFILFDVAEGDELYRYDILRGSEWFDNIDPDTGKFYIEDPDHEPFWYDNDTNTLHITSVPEPEGNGGK